MCQNKYLWSRELNASARILRFWFIPRNIYKILTRNLKYQQVNTNFKNKARGYILCALVLIYSNKKKRENFMQMHLVHR